MRNHTRSATQFVVVILVIALVATVSFLLHILFGREVSPLTIEILAAVLGVVLVVASVGVTIHFQNRSEMERQFRVALFDKKLGAYLALLECTAKADDDGRVDTGELEQIRNHATLVALVGGDSLVQTVADFLEDITEDGKIDTGPEGDSFASLIQRMRADLDVVEGDVMDYIKKIVPPSMQGHA